MSTPLVPFHNAMYTALDAIDGLTAYSFLPESPSFPYVYIERKQVRGQDTNRSKVRHAVRSKLLIATNSKDINELQALIDSVEDAFVNGITLVGDWAVIMYSPVPDVDVFPVENYDGSQGHAAEVFHDFVIQSTA